MTPTPSLDRRLLPALLAALLLPACATTGPMARAPTSEPPTPAETPPPTTESTAIAADAPPSPETAPVEMPAEAIAAVATEATGREVFDRIRARLQAPACADNARARQWQSRYAQHPTTFSRRLAQTLPLLDFVVAEAERAEVPGEFVFIPLVESWFEPGAIGRGGPTGMWQMIGSTARNHGVVVGKGYDGRLSPVDSTRAALSYLRTLGDMFDGDWQATVMAYNAGEYRLLGALKRSGQVRRVSAAEGVPAGLSQITYDYVAKLQALSCLVAEPQRHGLTLPDDVRFARLAPVLVGERMGSLEQLAVRAGLDARELRAINPAYRGGRIANGAPRVLLLPLANAPRVAAVEAEPEAAPAAIAAAEVVESPTSSTHEVRSGDTLSHIARRYGLTLGALRKLNKLGNTSRIKPGQVLRLVP